MVSSALSLPLPVGFFSGRLFPHDGPSTLGLHCAKLKSPERRTCPFPSSTGRISGFSWAFLRNTPLPNALTEELKHGNWPGLGDWRVCPINPLGPVLQRKIRVLILEDTRRVPRRQKKLECTVLPMTEKGRKKEQIKASSLLLNYFLTSIKSSLPGN